MKFKNFQPLPAQEWMLKRPEGLAKGHDVAYLQGGMGCVDGDTLIDLWEGEGIAIRYFKGGFVKAWDGTAWVKAWATQAKAYDATPLYRVETNTGRSIVATGRHKFLTPDGWAQVYALKDGSMLLCPDEKNGLTHDVITQITYVKTDVYYDLHVPTYNNYSAHGFVNHNSGKTLPGAIGSLMLLQKYCNTVEGLIGIAAAPTFPMLMRATVDTYLRVMKEWGMMEKRDYIFNKHEMVMSFPVFNDAKIYFLEL